MKDHGVTVKSSETSLWEQHAETPLRHHQVREEVDEVLLTKTRMK